MRYQQTLKYKTIKAFLHATRSMLEQFPAHQTRDMDARVRQLETQLERAYAAQDGQELLQVSQQTDILALDLLDFLDALNLSDAAPGGLQA